MAAPPLAAIRDLLPAGGTLDDEAFGHRHALLRHLLVLHVPAIAVLGTFEGAGPRTAAELVAPLACAILAGRLTRRGPASAIVSLGLVLSSGALVRVADGAVEGRFHLFVVLGFLALYQSWWAVLTGLAGATATLAIGAVVAPEATFGVSGDVWPTASIHAGAVLGATLAQVLAWRAIESEHRRGTRLAAELARAQSQIEARESVSELFVNLARRNQALLDRQIDLIVTMEEREADPDQLANLFALDHLATRIRRNAESLLVLSGEEPARRWGRPVALADVARAAVAEVEDYRRADVAVDEGVAVAGRAVADLAHLLAELVENGLQFSPPEARVRVTSALRPDGRCVVTIEDRGIGMSGVDLSSANDLLARPPEVDLRLSKRLGFHVVSRLAARYGIGVELGATPGGGLTATVQLPADLLAPAEVAVVAPPAEAAPASAPALGRLARRPPTVAGRVLAPVAAAGPTSGGRPLPDPLDLPATGRPLPDHLDLPANPRPAEVVAGRVDPAPVAVAGEPLPAAAVVAPAPIVPPSAPVPPGAAATDPAPGGLPRRVPQAALHPDLAAPTTATAVPAAGAAIPPAAGSGGRSAEVVRSVLSSFQAGQNRGRTEAQATPRGERPERGQLALDEQELR